MPLQTPPLPPSAAAAAAPGPAPFGFGASVLGESLNVWRRSALDGAACGSPERDAAQPVTCTAPPVDLGGGQVARDITYEFVGGRLTTIRYLASIDAYDRVRARLDARFGRPHPVTYDQIQIDRSLKSPHLKAVWRSGDSTITLNDPEADGRSLSVTYRLTDPPPHAAKSA